MRRLLLALLPAILALGLVACGDDEEEEAAKGQGTPTTAEGEPGPPPGTQPPAQRGTPEEKEEVRAAVARYLEGLANENASQVCETLTEDAQRILGRDLGIEARGCENAAREAGRVIPDRGTRALRDANVLSVTISDDIATANVALAGAEVPVQLRRVDDEWRVSNANEKALLDALP